MASATSDSRLEASSKPQIITAFRIWRRLMRYMWRYRLSVITAIVGIIGTNILAVTVPYILRDVVDIGIAAKDHSFMLNAGLLVVGLGVLRGLTAFFGRYLGERLAHCISYDIRNDIYDKVQRQSFTYHDNAQVGTIITRAISDVNEIQRYFSFGLMDGLNVILLLVGVLGIMLATSPVLAIIAFVPLLPLGIYSQRFVKSVHPRWKKVMDRMQVLSNHLQENASAQKSYAYSPASNMKSNDSTKRTEISMTNSWISSRSGSPSCRKARSWPPCLPPSFCSSAGCWSSKGWRIYPSA